MALSLDTKTTFEPRRILQPIYTGGTVALSEDGRILATCLGEEALLSDLDTGRHLARIGGDGEAITTLALTPDASYLVICSRSLSMRIYALQLLDDGIDAKLLRTLKPHTTPIVTAAVDSTSSLLATGSADGVVKVWDIRAGFTTHTFHGHSGVISALSFFLVPNSTDVQPTSRSKKRKSHEIEGQAEAAGDAGSPGFHLASGGEDGKIRIWDLHKRKSVASLDAHASVVRAFDFTPGRQLLASASRDKTVMLWDSRTWKIHATIPILEEIEAVGFVGDSFFYTAGERGVIRVWNTSDSQEITETQPAGGETDAVVQVLNCPKLSSLLSVHADQTLKLHAWGLYKSDSSPSRMAALPVYRRISGTHDEVIDLAYIGPQRNMLALATNLDDIRIVSIDESRLSDADADSLTAWPYFGADVALLKGHTDIIITLDVDWSGHWLATGAKDNTARLWRLEPANDSYTCYATFTGHAESIGAVSLPRSTPPQGSKEHTNPLDHPPKFLITGSQDKTVKRWEVPALGSGKASRASYTRKAHDKDINAISTSYSHSNPLFASASQDRTVKIWDVENGEAIGVLRGHKRGVWAVAFSPPSVSQITTNEAGGASTAKGMIVTGSGDKSVRVWSLADYTCLRTFEGHANSVLKVVWLPAPADGQKGRGAVQVASAAGDGLVKIWDVQQGECATTLDNHIDRVWALAVKPSPASTFTKQTQLTSPDETMLDEDEESVERAPPLELVSGSADSTLTFWTDTTASTALKATTQATARIEQDQELQNHIRANNYREAIVLALQLNHPKRLLDLFTAVVNGPQESGSFTGRKEVDEVIGALSDGQLWILLKRLRDWNANARTHLVAQHILFALLRLYPKDRLLNLRKRRRKLATREAIGQGGEEGGEDELVDSMAQLSTGGRDKEGVKDVVDALKAYTERHYARLDRAAEERFVLLWTLEQMDEVGGGAGDDALLNGHALTNGDVEMMRV
ncbi:small nucleolar ribonucleoprotein-like protein complex subunit [Neohortaea acidophila]|uniref:Small nucleolar ribonucleoprotein-like protein complex subunit n=1 Tax=Neohortaea acidophila TaxID=245834 RepID=A0A6A6PM17_9PEZI|nr:small nucleolar ribonucleoprotein-like protein complex subunit [Neohortaea acidophila]KAF2480704.1 small nucleolar ribonucleoprotein-like protein complex subunit [Neohortaea acidophila]